MKHKLFATVFVGAALFSFVAANAQTAASNAPSAPPTPSHFTVSTGVLNRMADELTLMSSYMGGTPAREAQSILTDLQNELRPQLMNASQASAPAAVATPSAPAVAATSASAADAAPAATPSIHRDPVPSTTPAK